LLNRGTNDNLAYHPLMSLRKVVIRASVPECKGVALCWLNYAAVKYSSRLICKWFATCYGLVNIVSVCPYYSVTRRDVQYAWTKAGTRFLTKMARACSWDNGYLLCYGKCRWDYCYYSKGKDGWDKNTVQVVVCH
jgi:hypothetical protein